MKPAVSCSLLRSTASGCREGEEGKSFLPFSSDAVAITVYPLSRKYLVTTDPRLPLAPVMRMVLGMMDISVKLTRVCKNEASTVDVYHLSTLNYLRRLHENT